MNQFKDYFLGVKKDMKRACSSQKCLRTGDLDHVGKTPYHHSFFEMLGNFSFGDYFKKDAIVWAWEFLTKILRIPAEKLRVSVHKDDREAFDIWKNEIGIPETHIAQLGDDSNFWPANAPQDGPNGPCGPCSEIFFDQGERYAPKPFKGPWYEDETGRFSEIWNLVFTQFDRQSDGSLKPLKAKNIDTGSGLERVACMLQGRRSNFEIDLFEPLLKAMKKELKLTENQTDILYRIVDHGRAVTFAIADGAFPSNEGRGYVIRKLIRRSVWQAQTTGKKEPFLYRIVAPVVEAMGQAYPEIKQAEKNIVETIKQEELKFFETLEKGNQVLERFIREAKKKKLKQLSGQDVFLLYDTYGFPDELTRQITAHEGLTINQNEFDMLMTRQKKTAKQKSNISTEIFSVDEVKQKIGSTAATQFLGYAQLTAGAKVIQHFNQGSQTALILNQTPFYPEGGGQVGDAGTIESASFKFEVTDTQKKDKIIFHIGKVVKGKIEENMDVKASVDTVRREATKRNHTATHLLQAALRQVLGNHVRQVGSLVHPSKLRFDFKHHSALSEKELAMIESAVNQVILRNELVETAQQTYEAAVSGGAIAFFGDKYGEKVRVINVSGFSKELCGGTHCERTGDIGVFVIASETAIGSGTRRIEAVTGLGALEYLTNIRQTIQKTADVLKSTPDALVDRAESLMQSLKQLQKDKKQAALTQSTIGIDDLIKKAQSVGKIKLVTHQYQDASIEQLRQLSDQVRKQLTTGVVILFGIQPDKFSLIVSLSKDLEKTSVNAASIAKEISQACGGSAGGRKDLAQGGGKNSAAIPTALAKVVSLIKAG